jgi:hypothetical protein
VTIPDELAAKVRARGFALETYVRDLVEETLSQEQPDEGLRQAAVDAMLKFAEKHGATLGGENLTSMIHEGHKY